jgi:hypothetical protein
MLRALSIAPWLVAAAAGGTLALAGCTSGVTHAPGANAPSVASLITSMKSSFAGASSVRVTGSLADRGSTVALSLGLFRSGNMDGTIKLDGADVKMLIIGSTAYEYMSREFFAVIAAEDKLPASACAAICGKYLSTPASSFAQFGFRSLSAEVVQKMPVPQSVPHITVVTYEGQPAYKLSGQGSSVYIAKNGAHYLLGLVDPAKFGTLNFSQWNSVPPPVKPPASQITSTG